MTEVVAPSHLGRCCLMTSLGQVFGFRSNRQALRVMRLTDVSPAQRDHGRRVGQDRPCAGRCFKYRGRRVASGSRGAVHRHQDVTAMRDPLINCWPRDAFAGATPRGDRPCQRATRGWISVSTSLGEQVRDGAGGYLSTRALPQIRGSGPCLAPALLWWRFAVSASARLATRDWHNDRRAIGPIPASGAYR